MNAMGAIWRDFVTANGRIAPEDPDYLRIALITVLGTVSAPLWGIMLIRNGWHLPQTGDVYMASYVHSRWKVFERLHELRSQLAQEVIRDPLTGLHNRRTFNEVLQRSLARTTRDRNGLAVLMFDLDHFKAYNDSYGHPVGDVVLKQVAAALQARFTRGDDVLFRMGGEEFCAVFFVGSREEACHMAAQAVDDIFALKIASPGSAGAPLTVSAGLVWIDDGAHHDSEKVYLAADDALYQAKETGRARYVMAA